MAVRQVDDKLTERFVTTVDQADEQRMKGLVYANTLLGLRQHALAQQLEWLARKYGENYPELDLVVRELDSGDKFLEALSAEIRHSRITPEPFDTNAWRVHGRVLDEANRAVKGASVTLSGNFKKIKASAGSAKTDENGYYSIILDEKQVQELNGSSLSISLTKDKSKRKSEDSEVTPAPGNSDYIDFYIAK